jgi:hypothetical protein
MDTTLPSAPLRGLILKVTGSGVPSLVKACTWQWTLSPLSASCMLFLTGFPGFRRSTEPAGLPEGFPEDVVLGIPQFLDGYFRSEL